MSSDRMNRALGQSHAKAVTPWVALTTRAGQYQRLALAIVLACLGMFILFGPTNNWSWDPSFYYAQMRSPIIDRDLNFYGETQTGIYTLKPTVTGLQPTAWPIGPSLLWAPFFLVAHAAVLLIAPASADGYAFPYIALVSLGSAAWSAAALVLIYRICRQFGGAFVGLITVALCFAATPLMFYTLRQPLMAHTTGIFASTLLLFVFLQLRATPQLRRDSGLLFGILLGLCFLTRWNGALFLLLPGAYYATHAWRRLRHESSATAWQLLTQVLIMAGAFIVTISPQLALWYHLYGRFVTPPQSSDNFVQAAVPLNMLPIFVDTNRGLLFWSPFILIGIIGMGWIKDRSLKWVTAATVATQVVLFGYRVDWYGGGGYGPRYFIELLPLLALGFMALGSRIARSAQGRAILAVIAIALLLHQATLMYTVEHGPTAGLDLAAYYGGQPLGLRWQAENMRDLLLQPSRWLQPRPFVAEDRQTILTNVAHAVRNPAAYRITGTALLLTPLVVAMTAILATRATLQTTRRFLIGALGYMAAWFAYLLLL